MLRVTVPKLAVAPAATFAPPMTALPTVPPVMTVRTLPLAAAVPKNASLILPPVIRLESVPV